MTQTIVRRRPGALPLAVVLVAITVLGVTSRPSAALQAASYTLVDLGPSDPALPGYATAINASGAAVGWSLTAEGTFGAWISRDGQTVRTLGPADQQGIVLDINAGRTAVGSIMVPADDGSQSGLLRAARWQRNEATELGTLGGATSVAYGINDKGHIVGASAAAETSSHAFVWRSGEIVDLGTIGGNASAAFDINNEGQIVGDSTTEPDQTYGQAGTHAFLLQDGDFVDLGTLGGDTSRAFAINDAGQVVGSSTVESGADETHAFLWSEETLTDLGTLPEATSSVANDVNSDGIVVGASSTTEESDAVLWQDGQIVNLNDLIPTESGIHLTQANGINDAGQIICTGVDGDDHQRIFILTPAAS